MGRDKDRLIGKTKAAFTSKTEQGIHSLCLTDGQPGVQQSPGNVPPVLLFPQLYILTNAPYAVEYPFGQQGSQLSLLCPLPPP